MPNVTVIVLAPSSLFGMFGNGIFNTDGAQWTAHRALIRPFFGELNHFFTRSLVDEKALPPSARTRHRLRNFR